MSFTYYQLLGLSPGASQDEIKSAYKSLALKYHPDKTGGNKAMEEHFKKVNEAYQVLSNPEKRRKYDLRFTAPPKPSPPKPAQAAKPQPAPQPGKAYGTDNPANQRPNTTNRERKSQIYSKPGTKPRSNQQLKYFLFAFVGLLAVIVLSLSFFWFMNNDQAEKKLAEAYREHSMGNYLQAMLNYTEVIYYVNDHAEAYTQRGIIRYEAIGDRAAALSDFQKALKFSEEPSALLTYYLGLTYMSVNDLVKAEEYLKMSIRSKPQYDSAWYALGELNSFFLEKYGLALSYFDTAVSLRPEFENAIFGKGYCQLKTSQQQSAVLTFDKLLKINPEYKDAWLYRAEALIDLDQTQAACESLERAISLGSEAAVRRFKELCEAPSK